MAGPSFAENPQELRSFAFAMGVVVLSVVAIAVFFVARGSAAFYIVSLVTFAVFLYLAYDLSKARQKEEPVRRAASRRKRKKR